MKKVIFTIAAILMACALPVSVWAQPYTPTMSGDTYGIAQGGGNLLGVPTPRDNNDGLADINDAINLLLGSTYARNSDVDFLQFLGPNSTWRDLSTEDNDGTFLAISLTAANSNTLGIYRLSDNIDVPLLGPFSGFGFLGSGTEADPFPAALSPLSSGEDFGFYLLSKGSSTNRWDSDPTNNVNGLDVIGLDHMLVYHLSELKGKTVVIGFGCTGTPGSMVCSSTQKYTFYDPFLITWEDKVLAANGRLGDEDFDDMIYLVDRVAPIPEPISMLLFGSGLAGLVGLRRKQG